MNVSPFKGLWNILIKEQHRLMCWLPIFLGLGIYIAVLEELRIYYLCVISLPLLFLALSGLFKQALISLMFLLIGFASIKIHLYNHYLIKPEHLPKSLSCSVNISDITLTSNGVSMNATIKDTSNQSLNNSKIKLIAKGLIAEKILLTPYFTTNCDAYIKAIILPPPTIQYYKDRNFALNYSLNDISATGILLSPPKVLKCYSNVSGFLYSVRNRIDEYFKNNLSYHSYTIACALITGRSIIEKDLRNNFADAGMAHILAISGLHLCLLGGVIYKIFRFLLALFPYLALRWDVKKVASFISLISVIIYLFISGNKVPAQRALVVYSITILAILIDRKPISMRSLSLAAIIILLFSPASLFLAGFQMSFAATAGLIAIYESDFLLKTQNSRNILKKFSNFLLYASITTAVASISVMPFTVIFFNKITLNSLLSNIIAIPLVGLLIIPSLVTAVTFWKVPVLSNLAFDFCDWGIKQLIYIANYVSYLPGSKLHCHSPDEVTIFIFILSFIWLVIWQEKWRWFGVFGLILSLGLYLYSTQNLPHAFIHSTGKVFAIKSDDRVITNSRTTARNTVKRWALNLGYEAIEKKSQDYFLIPSKTPMLALIPHYSNISSQNLDDFLMRNIFIIDLRQTSPKSTSHQPIISFHDIEKIGNVLIYFKKNRITLIDSAGQKVYETTLQQPQL